MRVRIGRPVSVTRYLDRPDDRMALRQITDEVMFEIRELSGQEYVDTYATKRSESLPAETAVIGAVSGNGHGSGSGNGHAPVGHNGQAGHPTDDVAMTAAGE
jgi:1-acyl-sn-glycerol-3-phosphate acyltransferase